MPVITLTIPSCSGCCDEPFLIVGDCESLSGTADLCGFSGYSSDDAPYDPMFPELWEGQLRKWGGRALSDAYIIAFYTNTGEGECTECDGATRYEYSGTAVRGCGEFTATATRTLYSGSEEEPCVTDVFFADGVATQLEHRTPSPIFNVEKTLTTLDISGTETCESFSIDLNYIGSGAANETLQEERFFYDSLADALAGGDETITSGDECCAETSSADLTEPESVDEITISGTAVRVPLTIFGCDPMGPDFVVYVTLEQDETEYVVEATVPCAVTTYFHVPQPQPGDEPICFVSASLTAP